jgi:hypothetical protein
MLYRKENCMKKRLLLILLAITMVLGLVSCGDNNDEQVSDTSDAGEMVPNDGENVTLFAGAENDYRIVYSADAGDAVKNQVKAIKTAVSAATGVTVQMAVDNSKTMTEVDREIVLGKTSRKESTDVIDKISGLGYAIEFVGEKLIVTASNETLLAFAIEELMIQWSVDSESVSVSKSLKVAKDESANMLPLVENGKLLHKVIVSAGVSEKVYNRAKIISDTLAQITGETSMLYYDNSSNLTVESEDAYEICIGETARASSAKLYSKITTQGGGAIAVDNNRITIGAGSEEALLDTINVFYTDLALVIRGAYKGIPAIMRDYSFETDKNSLLANLPQIDVGTVSEVLNTGKNAYLMYVTNITGQDYNNYVAKLKNNGCTEAKTYSLASNQYSLMKNQAYTAYLSYLPTKNAMRVYVGEPTVADPTMSEVQNSSVAEPRLWQLDVDSSVNNGGMSYVARLTDGTFLVIDGGYQTDKEAKNLYDHLVTYTSPGQKPIISAWIITHAHIDHYGALVKFADNYNSKVDVKAFYYNMPHYAIGDISKNNVTAIEKAMSKWSSATRYSAVHSGMQIGLAGATMTVVCTYEDVYPSTPVSGNDTSMVFRLDIAGKKVMITGDAQEYQSAVITSTIDQSILKSDIVQMSHHGYEGCSETFYSMVDAATVMWPMPKNVFNQWYNNSLSGNKYIREQVNAGKVTIVKMGYGTQLVLY